MDPNATLAQIRAILARNDLELPDYELLADLTQALDEWIVTGGFLPEAWTTDLPARLAQWRAAIAR